MKLNSCTTNGGNETRGPRRSRFEKRAKLRVYLFARHRHFLSVCSSSILSVLACSLLANACHRVSRSSSLSKLLYQRYTSRFPLHIRARPRNLRTRHFFPVREESRAALIVYLIIRFSLPATESWSSVDRDAHGSVTTKSSGSITDIRANQCEYEAGYLPEGFIVPVVNWY